LQSKGCVVALVVARVATHTAAAAAAATAAHQSMPLQQQQQQQQQQHDINFGPHCAIGLVPSQQLAAFTVPVYSEEKCSRYPWLLSLRGFSRTAVRACRLLSVKW